MSKTTFPNDPIITQLINHKLEFNFDLKCVVFVLTEVQNFLKQVTFIIAYNP